MRVEAKLHIFGSVRMDARAWPLLVMELGPGRIDDLEFVRALDFIEDTLRSGMKSYQITDLSQVTEAPSTQRRIAANWSARTHHLQRDFSVGGSLVAPNAFVRGVITAVHWLKHPPAPTRVVATREEALANARAALVEAGVQLPFLLGGERR